MKEKNEMLLELKENKFLLQVNKYCEMRQLYEGVAFKLNQNNKT